MAKKNTAAVVAPEATATAQPVTAPTAPPTAAPKDTQNGITRPKAGTKTGEVWRVTDELSAIAGGPAARADVMAKCTELGINPATIMTQYGRWRAYHGLVTPRGTAQANPAAPAAPAAPSAATATVE